MTPNWTRILLALAAIFAALTLLLGCGTTTWLETAPGHVRVGVVGTPDLRPDGIVARLRFSDPDTRENTRETSQRITMASRPGWVGVETHLQPMWLPDYQTARFEGTPWAIDRTNTVAPGRTSGCPWFTPPGIFKGVCMIEGWLDDQGRPVANQLYFAWGGRQGGRIVQEDHARATTYRLQAWSPDHPDNPTPGQTAAQLTIQETSQTKRWP